MTVPINLSGDQHPAIERESDCEPSSEKCAHFWRKNPIKRDEIAARQLWVLKQRYRGKLRITDVNEMFLQMSVYV
jgi:hypothetical protein